MNKIKVFIIIVLFYSCHAALNQPNLSYDYNKLQENFKEEFYSHFPRQVSGDYIFNIEGVKATKTSNRCGASLLVNMQKEEITKLKERISDSILAEYKPSDRCLLTVNMLTNNIAGSIFIEHYNKLCTEEYIPVPDFSSLFVNSKLSLYTEEGKLTDNFTLYILKSEPGKFLDKKYLTEGIGLTEKWRNGYSRGIAINEKDNIVIYWLEIW
ncbi:MAG: hypothetical protein R6U19_10110 [Bacteroidales bacterium]